MPRPQPHPLALFSLKPLNRRAHDVIAHPINDHLVSTLDDGTFALNIGHILSISGNTTTLATLGRNADIIVGGSSIAKVQCSFEIDPYNTNIVMFYDRSHSLSTQVFGENATPFEYERPRKVVVHKAVNTMIGIGGEKRNLVLFELKWHYDPIGARRTPACHHEEIGEPLGSGAFGIVHKVIVDILIDTGRLKLLKRPPRDSERIT
ncbi:hypothetical protein F5Y03DRAFT_18937 [Xylaria venustula]|nr:hypothetical protein F5Y03DRAFT_18937 [Xylaria venustula]